MNIYLAQDSFRAIVRLFFLLNGLAIAFFSGEAPAAAVRPMGGTAVVRQVTSPSLRLESLIVEVNGERRRVDPANGFVVVRGDLVTVIDGWLLDKTKSVPLIDVAGYSSRLNRSTQDDRGKVIDTGHDVDPRESVDGKGLKYEIRALGSGVLYGHTFMTVESPVLLSLEVEVNGERRKLSAGDKLVLGPRDGIRVIDIHTNVRGNENVNHELSRKSDRGGRAFKEIRFTRGDVVFARIPIEWQGQ